MHSSLLNARALKEKWQAILTENSEYNNAMNQENNYLSPTEDLLRLTFIVCMSIKIFSEKFRSFDLKLQ